MKHKLIPYISSINIVLLIVIILSLLYLIVIPKKEYFNIPDDKINEELCKKWFTNRDKIPIKNPLSNRRIDKNGDLYKELNKKCRKYEKVNKKNYKSIDTVPNHLKVLYKMLYDGFVKVIEEEPTEKYDRKKIFGDGWKNVKNSDCDIRSILLYKENKGNLVFNPARCNLTNECKIEDLKCTIYSGEWQSSSGSYFINNQNPIYNFSKLIDVDHTVPLKHAYYAGAFEWSDTIRKKYANDLTPGHLFTMVYYLNTEKGDKSPSDWLPPSGELKYVSNWLAIKYRYGLIIEPIEFNAILNILEKYNDFTPDDPIDINKDIGYSTKSDFDNPLDPVFKTERDTFIKNFNTLAFKDKNNIVDICQNKQSKKQITNNHLTIFKNELSKNDIHSFFGLLRPEYVNLIKDKENICNFI